MNKEQIVVGGIYQHYKGKKYRLINVVRHSETLEELVMYETLYENDLGKLWVRPKEMFTEHLSDGKPRFKYLAEAEERVCTRPDFIKHFSEIQEADDSYYNGSDELLSVGSPFAKLFGFKKLGIHHEVLKPGRRTSWPHAESDEEEFAYVIEGNPDVWVDGELYPLKPGDGVGFPSGTGISHTFINNTDKDVRLLVVGEASKKENKIHYPLHPKRNDEIRAKGRLWEDIPQRVLGSHDGLPDAQRKLK